MSWAGRSCSRASTRREDGYAVVDSLGSARCSSAREVISSLAKNLPQVILDRAAADEQPRADLRVGQSVASETRPCSGTSEAPTRTFIARPRRLDVSHRTFPPITAPSSRPSRAADRHMKRDRAEMSPRSRRTPVDRGFGSDTARRIVEERHDGTLRFDASEHGTTFHPWLSLDLPTPGETETAK
jgi:hypothetical protein